MLNPERRSLVATPGPSVEVGRESSEVIPYKIARIFLRKKVLSATSLAV